MSKSEIYIVILYDNGVQSQILKEISAGLEEEGVPFRLQQLDETLDCVVLGKMAAAISPLQVGIGVDHHGDLCLHHEKLEAGNPYLREKLGNGRNLGKNAARLSKGLPLYLW
ncbi:glycerol dehydratase reactivase beta/small subunit family protein [Aneurinibacillus sp. Ricciae_BoGa-3]|uniref:glycerol dehydratase reactivase beta/small subunit family protein n=1 Tax=Aneurinibacillus sp. Ricciae_BoGa-3 TaxID=3022697 RepID=UPI002341D553|nr:glycerol dehydratase reactivase beta/small subunit family protein [Aneurinibacillus sp. Ricciae_BoGa-3]WCK52631.1 glycerol dehydratase reactivase beta/small subunit family protein [Aneurinibacillus sp. Ricciae_BoGa-3]